MTDVQVILKVSGHMDQDHMGQGQRSRGLRSAERSRPLGQNGNFMFYFQDRLAGNLEVKSQMGQGRPKGHDICRWAHVNVKLHFLS